MTLLTLCLTVQITPSSVLCLVAFSLPHLDCSLLLSAEVPSVESIPTQRSFLDEHPLFRILDAVS